MHIMCDQVAIDTAELLPRTERFLLDTLALPSLPGREQELADFCARVFSDVVDSVEEISLTDSLKNDPDYASPLPDVSYDGRSNLRLRVNGTGGGRSLVLCAHLDTVPPGDCREEPGCADGVVYGRGACDDKGQIAVIFLMLSLMRGLGIRLRGDLIVDLVVEEEIGGNGALALARQGLCADGAIVMEPTNLAVCTAARGALWLEARCLGVAGHSGVIGSGKTALETMLLLMEALKSCHQDVLRRSVGTPPFEGFDNPMPLTFGRLHAGDWPSMRPSWASVEGVFGFLPNTDSVSLRAEITSYLRRTLGEDLWGCIDWRFTVAREPTLIDPGHPIIWALAMAVEAQGRTAEISALPALTDACFYQNYLGIPTVVFGVGQLCHAHSRDEQVKMADIGLAARILLDFAGSWCGLLSASRTDEGAIRV